MLPPFSKLLLITLSSENLKLAEEKARKIKVFFENLRELKVLGPIPCQIFFINKKYRFRLLIKSLKPLLIQNYLANNNLNLKENSKIQINIDIDPYNFY